MANKDMESPIIRKDTVLSLHMEVRADAWAVDAVCSGNPGPMEYKAVDLHTGRQVFHYGPVCGTKNIGEFLAIVHAISLAWQRGLYTKTIYSDSYNAILWAHNGKCKTKLERSLQTDYIFQLIARAEYWLQTHKWCNPLIKWEKLKWGDFPVEFGRKQSKDLFYQP